MVDVAHLEKMGRELKCPICKKAELISSPSYGSWSLLKSTVSLPCNHVFCSLCISKSMKSDSVCPVCKMPYSRREVRPSPHMDNMVGIYKCMELASGVNLLVTQVGQSSANQEICKEVEEPSGSGKHIATPLSGRKRKKKGSSRKITSRKNMTIHNADLKSQEMTKRSSLNNKRIQVSPHPRRVNSVTPVAIGEIQQLDSNRCGMNEGDFSDKNSFEKSDARPKEKEQGSVVARGVHHADDEGKVTLSPFFWLREQETDDESSQKQSCHQLEADHVTDSPLYAIPAFSDLKDSEDGSPDKGEVHSRSKLLDMFESELFEWTQRPCSPELHSAVETKKGQDTPLLAEDDLCEPTTLSTELPDTHGQPKNPISGQESSLVNSGMYLCNQRSDNPNRSQDSSDLAKRTLKTTLRTVLGNPNRSMQRSKRPKSTSSLIKKQTKLSSSETEKNAMIRKNPNMDDDSKNTRNNCNQGSGNGNRNKRKTCIPVDLSDDQVKDTSAPSAAGKSCSDFFRNPNRSCDSTSSQPQKGTNDFSVVPFADLSNLGGSEIDNSERKNSEHNSERSKGQGRKMLSAECCKTCTVERQELNLSLPPSQNTEPSIHLKTKSSDQNGSEKNHKECLQVKQHVRRGSMKNLKLGKPPHIMDHVNWVKGKKNDGQVGSSIVSVVSNLQQAVGGKTPNLCDIPQDESIVSKEETPLQGKSTHDHTQTVTVAARKELKLKHCGNKFTPISCIFCGSSVDSEVNLKHKEDQYDFIWEIIDKRWDRQMHKPLHAAALYLNPGLYYEYEGIESNAEIKGGLFQVISTLTSSSEQQEKVSSQLMQYRSSCGGFGLEVAVNARKVYAPAEWWMSFGYSCPELQQFAIKILSLTCSASPCERNWSTFEMASGSMLHFANGRTVSPDYGGGISLIHAHIHCAEWAPDVYFEEETVINLEKEAVRSKKIKCNSCGIKGAALGCYERSCRKSYHVPCAKSIVGCRWDMENFVMLCPLHASSKLPIEQPFPKRQKINHASHNKDTKVKETASHSWHWASGTPQKWILCCSALACAEKELVSRFSKVAGLQVLERWSSNVTHVIASIDEIGACKRTLKFMLGVLEGKWIVNVNWIEACLEAMTPVDEEPYEITLDVHGNRNGPQNGRMRVLQKGSKLFSGLEFYFSGDFVASYRGYLQDLIVSAGGTVLQRKPIASELSTSQTFIIYNIELPEKCKPSQTSSVVHGRRKEAEALARSTGAKAIDNAWILDSISAHHLQSLTK